MHALKSELTHGETLDSQLLDLAWSLWTELGVAGHQRKHRQCVILPEELILLTAAIAEEDPRLRETSFWEGNSVKTLTITESLDGRPLVKITVNVPVMGEKNESITLDTLEGIFKYSVAITKDSKYTRAAYKPPQMPVV